MKSSKPDNLRKTPNYCSICNSVIEIGEEYNHELQMMCEYCYMGFRTSRVRKTHWQYLKSTKTEYLIPGKKD